MVSANHNFPVTWKAANKVVIKNYPKNISILHILKYFYLTARTMPSTTSIIVEPPKTTQIQKMAHYSNVGLSVKAKTRY